MPGPVFDAIVTDASPAIKALARRLHRLIRELDPDVVEVVWERQRIAGFGVGPKKMSEHYVYLAPQSKHLNVGFYRGALLDDPAGLLEGTGKLLRHVKVASEEDAKAPALRALIVAARAERKAALGAR